MADRYKNLLMNIKLYSLTFIATFLVWGVVSDTANAQQQVLELTEQSVDDAAETGAAGSLLVRFLNNTDDPTGSNFSPYWPVTTAEIRLFNFNEDFGHAQNTSAGDFDGLPVDYNPPVAIGWEFGLDADDITNTEEYGTFPDGVRNTGQADEKFKVLGALPGAVSGDFTSTESNEDGEGIDINENWAALITAGFNGLAGQPMYDDTGNNRIRYRLADMEIIFERPVTNPVLHFSGLGGIWDVNFSTGGVFEPVDEDGNRILVDEDRNIILTDEFGDIIEYDNETCETPVDFGDFIEVYDGLDTSNGTTCVDIDDYENELDDVVELILEYDEAYENSATIDFQLNDNGVTISKLSGNTNFEVGSDDAILDNDGGSTTFSNLIFNNANNPDDTDGAAHGSVLVTGENITSLTFSIYARGTHSPEAKGFGWAGGEGWVAEDISGQFNDPENDPPILDQINWNNPAEGFEALEYFFAEDATLLSISAEVQDDTVLLTEGDSYRMLTSPVAGKTYDDLIGALWTQGGVEEDGYNTSAGDPNIFTWPLGVANSWVPSPDLDLVIPTGEGFLMTVFEDDNFDGIVDEEEEFDNPDGSKLLLVTGSEAAPPIEVTDETPGGNPQSEGWLLLGNPFKDPISISELFNRTTNIQDVVYVWDRGEGDVDDPNRDYGWRWAINDPEVDSTEDNPVLGSMGQDVLMPFQGFFMQRIATTDVATVQFDASTDGTGSESLRATSEPGDIFFRKDRPVNNLVVLELTGENLNNSLWLRFSDYGSMERLNNDVLELASYNQHYAHFSTRKSDDTQLTMAQLPLPNKEFELPVSVETTRPGSYTISASDFNLSMAHDLYLVDLHEDVSVRIDENFSYRFDVNQAAKANPSSLATILSGPQKVTTEFADRFLITTQPRETESTMPDAVALNQNYPNPFNPTTQITYELPQQTDVRLEVYDMVGRQVATLVNETVQAGVHNVNFDASSLSSGVYIYRLQAGSTTLSRKLTVIK